MLALRRRMQIVFQDPFSSLNPRMTIAGILGEALDTHKLAKGAARRARIGELLELVGLHPDHARRYPHEFSGGQRQRIGIARALAVQPEFLVADEPVSALDVSVQAQVLNLLQELQKTLGLSMLFISHDLAVVEYLCDDMVVMYLGRVMERGPSRTIYARPRHPYTKALLATAPIPDPKARRERIVLQGDIPSPLNPPSGCVFRTRCPSAIAACAETVPPLAGSGWPRGRLHPRRRAQRPANGRGGLSTGLDSSSPPPQPSHRRIKLVTTGFALIGAGLFGERHAQAYSRHPLVDFAAVCDLDEARAKRLAETYGARRHTTESRRHPGRPGDQGRVGGDPDHAHRAVAVACAEAGKHILVEKPLATTVEDAEAIVAAADEAGVTLMVDFHNRANPPMVATRDAVARGDLGKVSMSTPASATRWPCRRTC